jgi:hypothetical protein
MLMKSEIYENRDMERGVCRRREAGQFERRAN